MSIHYPDPDHPDAEIILSEGLAWRRYADGREEGLTEEEEETWYKRLAEWMEATARP